MRFFILPTCLVFIGLSAHAQTSEDQDKGWLVELIQDQLSDSTRDVQIDGFAGALSSNATIDRLRISDRDGVWFDAHDLSQVWDRGALLSGEIDIDTIRAGKITIFRAPVANLGSDLPSAQPQPFALPELPVSVQIGDITAERIELGAPIMGEMMILTLTGSADLSGGAGDTQFTARRIDHRDDRFDIAGSFNNESRVLDLNMNVIEAENGMISRLIGLPGAPSIGLHLTGSGPLDNFGADLRMASDGQDRIAGQMRLGSTDQGQSLDLNIGGDVTALFAPEYRYFFGPDIRLIAQGTRQNDGALTLDDLRLTAQGLRLSGQMDLAPDYWPNSLSLDIDLSDGSAPVLLPLTGPPTTIQGADLSLNFDANVGPDWLLSGQITDLNRPGLSLPDLTLNGTGQIDPGSETTPGGFSADLTYQARDIALEDAGLAQALVPHVTGTARLNWVQEAPVKLTEALILTAGMEALASAEIDTQEVRGDILINTRDLSRFSTLAGLPDLAGNGGLALTGSYAPLTGETDAILTGQITDLKTGIAQADPLLRSQSTLAMALRRDESGTELTGLTLGNDSLSLTGQARVDNSGVAANLNVSLADIAPLIPGLSGPAQLVADITPGATDTQLNLDITAPGTDLNIDANIAPPDQDLALSAQITGAIQSLSPYGRAFGVPLTGATEVNATLTSDNPTQGARARVALSTRNITINPAIDAILRGTGQISADLGYDLDQGIAIRDGQIRFPQLSADLDFASDGQTGQGDFSARLNDAALLAEGLNGALTASGTARMQADGNWAIDAETTAAGTSGLRLNGTANPDGNVDLSVTGVARLALANSFIAPRRIDGDARLDLRVNGPAGLDAVSGTVTIPGARLSAPSLGEALDNITGTVTIINGQAQIGATGDFVSGGDVSVTGSLGLLPPNNAAIRVDLDRLVLRDPTLYDTTLSGQIRTDGPLAGGAQIAGDLTLGTTELQIPSSSVSALGDLPDVIHDQAPSNVRQTLTRAGLGLTPRDTPTGTTRPYPLDLTLNAPSRIFVRGRGLDAELGGSLRLTGTSDAPVPLGQFALIRGRIDILQQRFTLTEGAARIEGDFIPFLTLKAQTETDDGLIITIGVEGPADAPEISFTSAPELPQDEVLAHLLFGRSISEISALQAVQLASAISTLAGRNNGGALNRFRENVGLDDLDVTADDQGNAAVRAGAYISENVYTNVTVDNTGTTEIELNLDVTDDVTIRGRTTTEGETALGIFYERDY